MPTSPRNATTLPLKDFIELRLRALDLVQPVRGDTTSTREIIQGRAFDALASQGQDLPGVLWSLGLRAPGATRADVEELFNDGAIMRNWPFRGTLHVMATEDIRWVLDAMGPRSLKSWAPRREHLGLTDEIIEAAGNELLLALDGGQTLSRKEATDLWKRAGLPADPPQVYHLILTLCNQGLIAWGPIRGKEQLLVSVRHWLTHAPGADSRPHITDDPLTFQQTVTRIAGRLVHGRGPMSVADITNFTKLPVTSVRASLEELGDEIHPVRLQGVDQEYWISTRRMEEHESEGAAKVRDALLLPGFDEFLLGFKDRSAHLSPGDSEKIVPGGNGMFKPTVVWRGKVVGTWSRKDLSKVSVVQIKLFDLSWKIPKAFVDGVRREAERYATFLGVPIEVQYV